MGTFCVRHFTRIEYQNLINVSDLLFFLHSLSFFLLISLFSFCKSTCNDNEPKEKSFRAGLLLSQLSHPRLGILVEKLQTSAVVFGHEVPALLLALECRRSSQEALAGLPSPPGIPGARIWVAVQSPVISPR